MSDNIPFDIQREIIKRVPDLKPLLRFRAVSKPWKSYIDSSEFISGYGARDTQPNRLLLRYIDNSDDNIPSNTKQMFICYVDDEKHDPFPQQHAPNVSDLVKQLTYSRVLGTSCGLWCLRGYENPETETETETETKMLVIWNPSIRKSVGICVPCVRTDASGIVKFTIFGFAVCPKTYDPTIVKISYLERYLTIRDYNMLWQVEIFKLSSKTWKTVTCSNMPRDTVSLTSSQVAIDKLIFWAGFDGIFGNDGKISRYNNLILSLNLITREFNEVKLPHSLANRRSTGFVISKLSESLVLSAYTYEAGELVYGLWMMGNEGGVMTSFTKLYNINTPDSSERRLLGFRKSGEPVMECVIEDEELSTFDEEAFSKIEVYKPCTKHVNDLGIHGDFCSFFVCPCTETLLLVDHSDCSIISNDYRGKTDGCGSRSGAENDQF